MSTPLVVRATRAYGAHPRQLLLVLLGFAIAGCALWTLGFSALWNTEVWWQSIAVWFVGAAVAHDLILFPAYAVADRVVVATTRRRTSRPSSGPPVLNFVRIPLMACALVTLLFLPGIIRQGADSYERATGQTQEPFLVRWLVLCAVICLLGLAAYLAARVRASRGTGTSLTPPARARLAPPPDEPATGARSRVSEDEDPVRGKSSGHADDARRTRVAVTATAAVTISAGLAAAVWAITCWRRRRGRR